MQGVVNGGRGESSPRQQPEKRHEICLAAETKRRGGLWRLVLALARSGETESGGEKNRGGVVMLAGLFECGLRMRFWASEYNLHQYSSLPIKKDRQII
jgi:hypothetical protein